MKKRMFINNVHEFDVKAQVQDILKEINESYEWDGAEDVRIRPSEEDSIKLVISSVLNDSEIEIDYCRMLDKMYLRKVDHLKGGRISRREEVKGLRGLKGYLDRVMFAPYYQE